LLLVVRKPAAEQGDIVQERSMPKADISREYSSVT